MSLRFISDLHLDDRRPELTEFFLNFLKSTPGDVKALYILGDLFDAWIGDDDPGAVGRHVAEALRSLGDRGIQCLILRGNRDFLIGPEFCATSGCRLLSEPHQLRIGQRQVLLMHGDVLCSDDAAYQSLRTELRSRQWQQEFLAGSVAQRRAFAADSRRQSAQHQIDLREEILDVNDQTVADTFAEHDVEIIIHGHTHRPAVHHYEIGGKSRIRYVLGEWPGEAQMVSATSQGLSLERIGP